MHWLWVVLIGLVAGALAKLIMPGKDPGGFIVTILLGIAGRLSRPGSVARSAGIKKDNPLASSCQWSERSYCWPSIIW